jgi:transcriptional/translational regulatory protein YebC/TACO1
MFSRTGIISFDKGVDEEGVLDTALEAGADDIINNADGSIDVHTTFENFGVVKDALDAAGHEAVNAEVTMLADNEVDLDLEGAQQIMRLVEQLEELDDVQNVYANAGIPDEVMAQLNEAS